MWLMTQHGFYSIVEKTPGTFHVRARERGDLDNLIRDIPLDQTVISTPEADYAYRLIVGGRTLLTIMTHLFATVDYPNFKGRIAELRSQRHKPYHTVWNVLARALGAYGRPGHATTCTKYGRAPSSWSSRLAVPTMPNAPS